MPWAQWVVLSFFALIVLVDLHGVWQAVGFTKPDDDDLTFGGFIHKIPECTSTLTSYSMKQLPISKQEFVRPAGPRLLCNQL